jgi:WD40 repeat protein
LFLRNDTLDKKIVITCSSQPNSELKVSELSHTQVGKDGNKQYQFTLLAQSKDDLNSESFKCLSSNPLNNDFFCSAGVVNTHKSDDSVMGQVKETGILVWKLDKSILLGGDQGASELKKGPNKRLKTGEPALMGPHGKVHCSGGVNTLKWSGPTKIFAGCLDHTIKIVNADRLQVEEILFT